MTIDLAAVQVHRDLALRKQLEADEGVRRAISKLRERWSGYGFGGRRSLLTGALRLTPSMAPDVAQALHSCRETIGLEPHVEVYVRPDPTFNAFCMRDPSGPVILGLSSHLVESFTPPELQFVIGHELGHAAFEHYKLPMPQTAMIEDMAGRMVSRPTSLDLYIWCRAAELSADRIGLLCQRDPEAAANSFFKLASGISTPRLKADLEAFAAQVESLASAPEARTEPRDDDDTLDCFSTHPYSPVRVRALLAFSKSASYLKAIGKGSKGLSDKKVAEIIDRDLSLMEPNYLQEKNVHSVLMRDILYRAGVLVMVADGEISENEISALRTLLGSDQVDEETGHEDMAALKKELEKMLDEAAEKVEFRDRARLVQHLTIIASADGVVDDREVHVMADVAEHLKVNPSIIGHTLRAAASPMD